MRQQVGSGSVGQSAYDAPILERHEYNTAQYKEQCLNGGSGYNEYREERATFVLSHCSYDTYLRIVKHMGTFLAHIRAGEDLFPMTDAKQLQLTLDDPPHGGHIAPEESPSVPLPIVNLKTADELSGDPPSDSGKQILADVTAAIESAPPVEETPAPSISQEVSIAVDISNIEKAMAAINVAMEKVTKQPDAPSPVVEDDTDSLTVQVFEMSCSQVTDLKDAVQCWFDHAGAIKKLSDTAKRRCSTTLALCLSRAAGIEPMEAQELIKAEVSKEQARRKALRAPEEPKAPETAPTLVLPPQGDVAAFLKRLGGDPKPVLGIAVKYACEALAKNGEVTADSVEKFLVALVGKHPVIDSVEAIQKITQTGKMKLYAGAAKVKLV